MCSKRWRRRSGSLETTLLGRVVARQPLYESRRLREEIRLGTKRRTLRAENIDERLPFGFFPFLLFFRANECIPRVLGSGRKGRKEKKEEKGRKGRKLEHRLWRSRPIAAIGRLMAGNPSDEGRRTGHRQSRFSAQNRFGAVRGVQ